MLPQRAAGAARDVTTGGGGRGASARGRHVAAMFDAFSTLLFMCTAMFFGALGVGYVPLACNLSPERLRAWTALGAGLLIGTALIVIIPEGVAMWYGAAAGAHAAAHEEGASSSGGGTAPHGHETRAAAPVQAHSHGHGVVGACLVAGYALMLLVDRVSKGHAHAHGHGGDAGDSHAHGAGVPGREDGSPFMKQDGATAARVAAYARDGAGGLERHGDSEAPGGVAAAAVDAKKGDSALLGMVVHALSDGVALGAASMSPSSALNWLVFVAIMLHKGPSALGLTVYLMHINLSKDEGMWGCRWMCAGGSRCCSQLRSASCSFPAPRQLVRS